MFYIFSHNGGDTPVTFWGLDSEDNLIETRFKDPQLFDYDVAVGLADLIKPKFKHVCLGKMTPGNSKLKSFDTDPLTPIISL